MPIQGSELSKASRSHVVASLSSIRNQLPNQWLAAGHPAAQGELQMGWAQLRALPSQNAVDAIAMSIPTHCVDGWSFAARSISALLAGDPHGCRHMAYYAQLRAALCILANLGIGIFNGLNFAIDASGNIVRIDPPASGGPNKKGEGTHKAVWAVLEEWGKNTALSQVFLDLLKFKGVSARDVLDTLWPGFISVTTVGTLISAWGLDLRRGVEDHKHRNNSSYAAHSLNPLGMRTSTNLGYLDRTWRLFEPSGGSGFDNLDRHLLRRMLLAQHDISDTGNPPATGAIATHYNNLPAAIRLLCPRDFVLSAQSKPDVLRYAELKVIPSKPLHMLSRALMLLRAATAFTHTSLTDAGISVSSGELTAWLDQIACSRGFCANGGSIGDGSGLWDDISLAIEDFSISRKPASTDLLDWKKKHPNGMPYLAEAERIPLWSFSA